jgi:hypothetical protein
MRTDAMLRCGSATLCEVEAMCDGCEVEVQGRDRTRRVAMRCEVRGQDRTSRIAMCVVMRHEVRGRDGTR